MGVRAIEGCGLGVRGVDVGAEMALELYVGEGRC